MLRALGSHKRVFSRGRTQIQQDPFGCLVNGLPERRLVQTASGKGAGPVEIKEVGTRARETRTTPSTPLLLSSPPPPSCRLAPAPSPGVVAGQLRPLSACRLWLLPRAQQSRHPPAGLPHMAAPGQLEGAAGAGLRGWRPSAAARGRHLQRG